MAYLWLKAAHVAVVMAFVGGLLAEAVGLALLPAMPQPSRTAAALRRWGRAVTTPAMLLAWALGLALVYSGGWGFPGWLLSKLALVIALSGLHGVLSGRLRRASSGRAGTVPSWAPSIILLCAAGIAVLAVVKPG